MIHLLDMIRTHKILTVPAVENAQGTAVKGCGKSMTNLWMTGSASNGLNYCTEAASLYRNVVSGNASVSPSQPEFSNAAGYQWVPVIW